MVIQEFVYNNNGVSQFNAHIGHAQGIYLT